jgi:hypothetical protein
MVQELVEPENIPAWICPIIIQAEDSLIEFPLTVGGVAAGPKNLSRNHERIKYHEK